MPRKRETSMPMRDVALFLHYCRVIKKYGNRTRFVNKAEIYTEVARPFFISPVSASRVISKKLRETRRLDKETEKELTQDVNDVLDALKEAGDTDHN
jgi:hypothetical protein